MTEIIINRHFALHRRLIIGRARHVRPERVVEAWQASFWQGARPDTEPRQFIAIGYDNEGILLEMTAQDASQCGIAQGEPLRVIFHAMPATKPFLRELGASEDMAEQ